MVRYRRNRVAGATYFFTVTLHERGSDALIRYWPELRNALVQSHNQLPLHIVAMVVVPERLDTLWTLPTDDDDYSSRWRTI